MKKVLSVLLVAMLLLGTLCAAAFAEEEQQTIRVLWWGSQTRHDLTMQMIAKFMEKYPNIKVEVEFTDWGSYWNKLATQVAGDLTPDVIQMDYAYIVQYASAGVLAPLDAYVEAGQLNVADIADTVLGSGRVNDTLYAIANGTNVPTLMYRKDLVEQVGMTLSMQPTLAEYLQVSKVIYEQTGHTDNYITSMGIDDLRFRVRNFGLDLYSEEGTALGFEDPQYIVDMWKTAQQADADGYTLGVGEDTAATAFDSYINDRWAGYHSTNELGAFEEGSGLQLDMVAIPSPEGATMPSTYFKTTMFWAVSANSMVKDAAVQFIDFYTNDADSYAIIGMDRGMPSSSKMRDFIKPNLSDTEQRAAVVVDFFSQPGNTTPIMNPDPAAHNEVRALLGQYSEQVRYNLVEDLDAFAVEFMAEANALLAK